MSFPSTPTFQGQYRGQAITKSTGDVFVPELWGTEVKRFRDQKFLAAKYAKTIPFRGKKGDRFHIPSISRAAVNRKISETPVNLQARTENDYFIDITEYKESSFMLEDLINVQSNYGLRAEYTREAGYALARDLDNSVLALRAAVANYSSQVIFNSTGTGAGTLTGTPAPLNYSAILTAKTILDAADVPAEDRVLIVSPQQYNALLAVDKFINTWYTNADYPVNNGVVGHIFDIPVYMTSQITDNSPVGYLNGTGATAQPTPGCTADTTTATTGPYLPVQDAFTPLPFINTAGSISLSTYNAAATNLRYQTALLVHPDWAIMAVQQDPMTEASRQSMYLADVVTMSHLYGTKLFRPDHAVIIHTSNTIPAIS